MKVRDVAPHLIAFGTYLVLCENCKPTVSVGWAILVGTAAWIVLTCFAWINGEL